MPPKKQKTPYVRLRRERRTSSIDQALGLPPPYQLTPPDKLWKRLRMQLRALWRLLGKPDTDSHRWTRGPIEQWDRVNAALVRKARTGDGEALAMLLLRDPRYLASEFVLSQIIKWKLTVISGAKTRPALRQTPPNDRFVTDEEMDQRHSNVLEAANDNLRLLANALAKPMDKKLSAFIDDDVLLELHEVARTRVARANEFLSGCRNPRVRIKEVAKKVRLAEKHVTRILDPDVGTETLAKEVTGSYFNLGYERIRKLITAAENK